MFFCSALVRTLRWLAPSLLLLVASCTRLGYQIDVSVTAPTSVQQMFSRANPGLVVGAGSVLGKLCAPSGEDFVFHFSRGDDNFHCEDRRLMNDSLDGHAYAVFADKAALDWMSSADRQAIACGVTGDVRELDGVHIISYDGTVIAWDEVATGDSLGTCAPDGNYHLAITLGAK